MELTARRKANISSSPDIIHMILVEAPPVPTFPSAKTSRRSFPPSISVSNWKLETNGVWHTHTQQLPTMKKRTPDFYCMLYKYVSEVIMNYVTCPKYFNSHKWTKYIIGSNSKITWLDAKTLTFPNQRVHLLQFPEIIHQWKKLQNKLDGNDDCTAHQLAW